MYMFSWKHGESFIQLPLKIVKATDSSYGIKSSLVCNECNQSLKQIYKCTACAWEGTIGDVQKRIDPDENIIYDNKAKSAFMKVSVEESIKVTDEVALIDVIYNVLNLTSAYEIYNNKSADAKATISKIHKWLVSSGKALVVNFGYRGKVRSGIIVPSSDRLTLVETLDSRLIREAKQQGLAPIVSPATKVLKASTVDKEPELYSAFIDKIKNGEELPTERIVTAEPEIIVQASFLDG